MRRLYVHPIVSMVASNDKKGLLFVFAFAVIVYGGGALINYFFE